LAIGGRTAGTPSRPYGIFEARLRVVRGQTTVLVVTGATYTHAMFLVGGTSTRRPIQGPAQE
jgi:hypothetical protein